MSLLLLGAGGGGIAPMVQPIFAGGGSSTVLSNTATRYVGLQQGYDGDIPSTGTTDRVSVMAVAGVLSNLHIALSTALSAGSWTFTVMKNEVATSLVVSFTNGDPVEKSDDSNTVTVAVGDRISIRSVPTSTPTAQSGPVQMSLVFTSNDAWGILPPTNSWKPSGSGTTYAVFGAATATATAANAELRMPTAGVIDKIKAYTNVAPGSGQSYTITLVKNGVDTSLTEQITGTNTESPAPTSNPVTVAAGDRIRLKVVNSASGSTSGQIGIGVGWLPDAPGESVHASLSTLMSASATRYMNPNGHASNIGGASLVNSIAPCAFTAKKLYADLVTAPGGATSRAFDIHVNGADTAVDLTISGSNTTGDSGADTVSVAKNDQICISSTPTSSPNASAAFKLSWVATVP